MKFSIDWDAVCQDCWGAGEIFDRKLFYFSLMSENPLVNPFLTCGICKGSGIIPAQPQGEKK